MSLKQLCHSLWVFWLDYLLVRVSPFSFVSIEFALAGRHGKSTGNTILRSNGMSRCAWRVTSLLSKPSALYTSETGVLEKDGTKAYCTESSNCHFQDELMEILKSRLQGDFDNYRQVLEDCREGRSPGPGGGHEHMHACFVPLKSDLSSRLLPQSSFSKASHTVIAAYYLNGNPQSVFRLRLYSLMKACPSSIEEDSSKHSGILMKLYAPSTEVMTVLKPVMDAPSEWETSIASLLSSDYGGETDKIFSSHFSTLEGCDVLWTTEPNPKRHDYLYTQDAIDLPRSVHAVLINEGGAILSSTVQPGRQILIKDELSLWEDALWINDRGYDVESGAFIYGNRRGVPYKVERVTNLKFVDKCEDGELPKMFTRQILKRNEGLSWTLGEKFRSEDEYNEYMGRINAAL